MKYDVVYNIVNFVYIVLIKYNCMKKKIVNEYVMYSFIFTVSMKYNNYG